MPPSFQLSDDSTMCQELNPYPSFSVQIFFGMHCPIAFCMCVFLLFCLANTPVSCLPMLASVLVSWWAYLLCACKPSKPDPCCISWEDQFRAASRLVLSGVYESQRRSVQLSHCTQSTSSQIPALTSWCVTHNRHTHGFLSTNNLKYL